MVYPHCGLVANTRRVDAIENGKTTITVVAPPGTSVTKVREGEQEPTTLH